MKTYSTCLRIAAATGFVLAALSARSQTVSEPPTIFYGKVLGTGSAQPFLVTEGELAWTIQRHDGTTVTLRTRLFALGDGLYSYRLEVPHAAIALGLPAAPGGVPLPPTPEVNVHASVTVDGQRATLLGPAPSAFTAEQLHRAATHRLDLGLDRAAPDSDGDGMADWWEDAHGLDKQDATDASHDATGDGITAFDAYLRGLDPARDARAPAILTTELVVYPAGTTAILPDAADQDSPPEAIVYTLTGLPAGGTLALRQSEADPAHPDRVLSPGAQFTHADVLRGRLVYDHDGSGKPPGALSLAVHDGDPAHPAAEAVIGLLPFEPGDYVAADMTDLEAQRILNHHYAACGFVVLDASPLPAGVVLSVPSAGLSGTALDAFRAAYGDDRRAIIVGGPDEGMSLDGGHRDDVLMPGPGDGMLAGGPGADAFVFRSFGAGRVMLADFTAAEDDEIDFTAFPAVPGAYVHRHLKLAQVSDGFELRTDLDGDGAGFTNLCVALPGLAADEADLYAIIDAGRLRVDGLRLLPRVSVAATVPQASENGPVPGQFTVTRAGDLSSDLTVSLDWSGTAENGKDYVLAPVTVLLPAGCASRDLVILPYDDGLSEAAETVLLSLVGGSDYILGASSQTSVTIGDLRMLLTVEAQKPLACLVPAASGRFILRRSGVTQSPVDVFLNIGGTAVNGQDYEWISDWIPMAANQVTAVISIVPKATALLAGGAETVDLSIATDAAYLTLATNVARVVIIERTDTFADWAAREFSVGAFGVETFAAQDPGGAGITHFQRYAFGLDPHHPSTDGLPRPIIRNGRLVVTFRKPLGRKDVRHTVIGMTNLRDPAGSKVDTRLFQPVPADDDPQRVYYELVPAAQGAPCAFMEVKAEWIQIP